MSAASLRGWLLLEEAAADGVGAVASAAPDDFGPPRAIAKYQIELLAAREGRGVLELDAAGGKIASQDAGPLGLFGGKDGIDHRLGADLEIDPRGPPHGRSGVIM